MRWLLPLLLVLIVPAAARDDGRYANSPNREWFQKLHSKKGPCCADADGATLKDNEWESVNDPAKPDVHYRVFIENQWIDVPDAAVVDEPNIFQRTIVWPYYSSAFGGPLHIEIRCFMPGAMT